MSVFQNQNDKINKAIKMLMQINKLKQEYCIYFFEMNQI